jgi:hypothetical protein
MSRLDGARDDIVGAGLALPGHDAIKQKGVINHAPTNGFIDDIKEIMII